MYFTISSGYQWLNKNDSTKASHSETAIKHLVNGIKDSFKKQESIYKINYRRLRASAGKNILDSIIKRIESSNVIIFDITDFNRNVLIELGIALYYCSKNRDISIYIIKEKGSKSVTADLPSDLQGYFISEYAIEKEKVFFKDNNSLRMSIGGDIKEFFQNLYPKKNIKIDELDENEAILK